MDFLGHYGELMSGIVEELFEDCGMCNPKTEGTNRTGTYVAKIRLHMALSAIRLIRNYFNTDELLKLITSNFNSILYYNSEVWHLRTLQN